MREVLFIGGPLHGKVLTVPDDCHRFDAPDHEDRGELMRLWSKSPTKKLCRASYRIEEYASSNPFSPKFWQLEMMFKAHYFRGLFFGVIDGEFTPRECLIEYIRRCVPAAKRESTDAL